MKIPVPSRITVACMAAASLGLCATHALGVTPMLAAGFDRTCAVDEPGRAYCWGDNSSGALGDGARIVSPVPGPVVGLAAGATVVATSPSSFHTCAITSSLEAYCWGNNANGQLGDGSVGVSTLPARVRLPAGVSAIGTGLAHTCAVQAGTLHCWGSNGAGQLGTGIPRDELLPAPVSLAGVRAITAGLAHTCVRTDDGMVWCWGENVSGQLGSGSPQVFNPTPARIATLSGVTSIASGYGHTCALRSDGRVLCWGDNSRGQLGDGTTSESRVPRAIAETGVTFVQLGAGAFHTCALTDTRRLFCWGSNASLQLGRTGASSTVPVEVAGLPAEVTQISLGWQHTCALNATATFCWGNNTLGQLGNGSQSNSATPTPVAGLARPLTALSAGSDHTCAIDASGSVLCWGGNTAFQLGDGQAVGSPRPVAVRDLPRGAVSITTGGFHGCALDSAGAVSCWGGGDQGQLGDGVLHNSSVPVPTRIASGATAIASGVGHVCAIAAGGGLQCWGANAQGQLGRGTTDDSAVPAAPVGLASGVVAVAGGLAHTCAVTSAGRVMCWGANGPGALGNGSTSNSTVPVAVSGISAGAQSVSVGLAHSCALMAGGSVLCWGGNAAGQLGDGTQTLRATPVAVVGLPASAKVSAGEEHTCALTVAGAVLCWGKNNDGQLGTGGTSSSPVPTPVPGLDSGVADIAAGRLHTCARMVAGNVFCWGHNNSGAAGDSTFAHRASPVVVVREGGGGSIAAGDWFFDLRPVVAKSIPADKVPVYLVNATGNAATAIVDVDAQVQFRAQDVGTTASTFVFAVAPATSVRGAALKDADPRFAWKALGASKADPPVQCALAQLNAQGQLVAVSAASLQAYASGVLAAQGQAVTIVNAVPASGIAGATFYVGYGPNGNAMLVNGTTRSVVSVPGTVSCRPQAPQTGWWYNPAEGGRGFSIEARGNQLFFAAFHYEPDGRATWNFAGGATSLDGSLFTSDFLAASSGQTLTGPYRLPGLANAGTVTFAFSDATHGTMIWPGGTVAIERQPFVPDGLAAAPQPGLPQAGWWWNPAESGRGFFIEWQGGFADIAGYMYDAQGRPTWYIAALPTPDPLRITGNWWTFANGQAMGQPYRAATRTSDNAGALDVQFSSSTTATMTLPDGRRIPLVRQAF